MKFAKRPGLLLGFFLMSLLVFAISVFGEANQSSKAILYPGAVQPIDRPEQFFQQAARQGNLLLLKAAIFDPDRDGEPDLGAWVRDELKDQPLANRYCLVQFAGPILPENRQALEKAGAQVIEYVPNNAFLVRMPAGQAMAVSSQAGVRWVGDFQPGYKLSPELAAGMPERFRFAGDQLWQISAEIFPGRGLGPGRGGGHRAVRLRSALQLRDGRRPGGGVQRLHREPRRPAGLPGQPERGQVGRAAAPGPAAQRQLHLGVPERRHRQQDHAHLRQGHPGPGPDRGRGRQRPGQGPLRLHQHRRRGGPGQPGGVARRRSWPPTAPSAS